MALEEATATLDFRSSTPPIPPPQLDLYLTLLLSGLHPRRNLRSEDLRVEERDRLTELMKGTCVMVDASRHEQR